MTIYISHDLFIRAETSEYQGSPSGKLITGSVFYSLEAAIENNMSKLILENVSITVPDGALIIEL